MKNVDTTIDYYENNAERFVLDAQNADIQECRDRLLKY